jgi:hypothetical protein
MLQILQRVSLDRSKGTFVAIYWFLVTTIMKKLVLDDCDGTGHVHYNLWPY